MCWHCCWLAFGGVSIPHVWEFTAEWWGLIEFQSDGLRKRRLLRDLRMTCTYLCDMTAQEDSPPDPRGLRATTWKQRQHRSGRMIVQSILLCVVTRWMADLSDQRCCTILIPTLSVSMIIIIVVYVCNLWQHRPTMVALVEWKCHRHFKMTIFAKAHVHSCSCCFESSYSICISISHRTQARAFRSYSKHFWSWPAALSNMKDTSRWCTAPNLELTSHRWWRPVNS